ncbi:MAG: sodium-dependent transporter [Clostridia bacterium]|nr:sodium-dependent transporter [Clostridia bacterium]
MEREKLSSRLGFILLSAGCAIGLGNVWKFPYLSAKYGGALFILIYLAFLVILGIPVMLMELAVGRASKKSIVSSFDTLAPEKKAWKGAKLLSLGNFLLMAFYVPVSGWFIYYLFQMISGNLNGLTDMGVSGAFFGGFVNGGNSSAILQIIFALVLIVGCFTVCGLGLKKGVENVTKYIMLGLFVLIIFMVIYSLTLSGAKDALKAYLIPSIEGLKNGDYNVFELISAAMGQAFFTLGLGIGSIGIFGSYLDKKRSLLGETIRIVILDTSIALMSGLIIFPALYTYNPGGAEMSGPPLIFIALSSVFANMAQPFGQIFGSIFFLFMCCAAISTVIAVFENIVSIVCDHFNISRAKSCIINGAIMLILVLPCIFGFSHLSKTFNPLGAGTTVQDLEDFILSYNLLPIGCLLYTLFCGYKFGWGYENFEREVNAGEGAKLPKFLKPYVKFILPIIIVILFIFGYLSFFA